VEVVDGTNIPLIAQYANQFDYVFTFWDIWRLEERFPREKWVAYVPISLESISDNLLKVLKDTKYQIAMSRYGEKLLREAGFDPFYAPHGVDMTKFRINPEGRERFRRSLGIDDDTFLIGSVGWNYENDRKGYMPLIVAFKDFLERHPKSALYLHTGLSGAPLVETARNLKVPVHFPNQLSYYLNHYNEDYLCDVYNGMDVFCLPTKGEGFGIPTVEAQACGTPVILSDNTTSMELCQSGGLIPFGGSIDDELERFYKFKSSRMDVREYILDYD
jgi:glycosyltransferase involved in cell wall biosynthesis